MAPQHIVGGGCVAPYSGDSRTERRRWPRGVRPSGGRSFWGQCQHGDPLGAAMAGRRSCAGPGPRHGWRSPFAFGRAPHGGSEAGGQATGPNLARDPPRAGGGAWGQCGTDEAVAASEGAADQAQKKSLHAAKQNRPDVAEAARGIFIRCQPALDPDRVMLIDEARDATNMAPRYGRAACGLRLFAAVPHGHWKVTTLVSGLRTSGITAPCVFDGAIKSERFRAIPSRSWPRAYGRMTLSCSTI